jgi:NitT/TauT family transport system permease protein
MEKDSLSPPWFFGGALFFLLAWELLARLAGSSLIFPGPLPVLKRFFVLIQSPAFFAGLGGSFLRVLGGLAVSIPGGILAGLAAGLDKRAASFLKPLFSVISTTPVMAVILIAFLVFGSGTTPVFTSFLMVFPVMAANTIQGVRGVKGELRELFFLYRMTPLETLRHLYVPSIMPFVLGGLRSGLALSWKVVVAAEVLVQPLSALGTGMQRAKAQLETPELFAWTLATVIAAALCEGLLGLGVRAYVKRRRG